MAFKLEERCVHTYTKVSLSASSFFSFLNKANHQTTDKLFLEHYMVANSVLYGTFLYTVVCRDGVYIHSEVKKVKFVKKVKLL
jgi:hypothetical protein